MGIRNQVTAPEVIATLGFIGTIPQVYESILVDFIFQPFAQDIVGRIANKKVFHVLELAGGTGRVTQLLAETFTEATQIIASDISEAMLTIGEQQVSAPNVAWQQIDIADIPFCDNHFDVVICQFGVMFLQDKIRGFSEIRRVLQPGGQLLFNVWGPLEENKIWQITNQVVTKNLGPFPAAFQKTSPFSCSSAPIVLQQLQDAGFDNCDVESVELNQSIDSADLAAQGFIHGLPFKEWILKTNPEQLPLIQNQLATAFAAQLGDSPLTTSFTALVFNTIK